MERQIVRNMFYGWKTPVVFNVTDDTEVIVNTIEELMKCEIDGERLVDICTKFTVIERKF